jgi:chromosome segregation ATPase
LDYKTLDGIVEEMNFLEKFNLLLSEFQIPYQRNSLSNSYTILKSDYYNARKTDQGLHEVFVKTLKDLIQDLEDNIQQFQEKATTVRESIKEIDPEIHPVSIQELKQKIAQLSRKIKEVKNYQIIMNVNLNDFATYTKASLATQFAKFLYETVQLYKNTYPLISTTPFSQLEIDSFSQTMEDLHSRLKKLKTSPPGDFPILKELTELIDSIYPFLSQLKSLVLRKMQVRNWNSLFSLTSQTQSFHEDLSLEELLETGILSHSDIIEKTTHLALGEAELEDQFISNRVKPNYL